MKKGLLATAAVVAAFAVAPSAQAACGLTDCQLVQGTVASVLSLTASTPVAISNNGLGTLDTGTSAADATGAGTVAVVSTNRYCVTVVDANGNGGLLKQTAPLTGAFTQPINWSRDGGAFGALLNDPLAAGSVFVSNAAGTLGTTYNVAWKQVMAGQNVPSGAYTVTAQYSATNC